MYETNINEKYFFQTPFIRSGSILYRFLLITRLDTPCKNKMKNS